MELENGKSVIYSPIKQANRRSRANKTPSLINESFQSRFQREPNQEYLTRIKYLDEDEDEQEIENQSNLDLETGYNNEASASIRPTQTITSQNLQQQESIDDDDEADDGQQMSVEEVYLCNCCGTTKELDPAMKYLSLFKNLFCVFNFLTLLFGFANLAMGLWFRIDPKVYELHKYIETQNFTIAGWLMLSGGFSICLLTLLIGCTASSRQSICLLVFYSIMLTLLTVTMIGTLVLLTVYGLGDRLERFLTKEIYEQIRRKTMSSELNDPMGTSDAAQFLDFVQVKMRCCGAQDFRDYQKLGMVIPTTCYTIAANFVNAPGCGQALRELFDLRAGLAAALTAASGAVQILAILLASLMVCSIYNYRATPRPASVLSSSSLSSSSRPQSRSRSRLNSGQLQPARLDEAQMQQFKQMVPNSSRPSSRNSYSIEV